jgi:hypothetical protein
MLGFVPKPGDLVQYVGFEHTDSTIQAMERENVLVRGSIYSVSSAFTDFGSHDIYIRLVVDKQRRSVNGSGFDFIRHI